MKHFLVLIVWVIMLIANAKAVEVTRLFNNKESYSNMISSEERLNVQSWLKTHSLKAEELKTLSIRSLALLAESSDNTCELGQTERLIKDAIEKRLIKDKNEAIIFASYLREANLIDDIFYRLLRDSSLILRDFETNAKFYPKRPFNLYTRYTAGFDYKKFYAPVKDWPTGKTACAVDTYFSMVSTLSWKNYKDLDAQMLRYNYIGLINGTLDLTTFNKLETLRYRQVLQWPIYLKRYFDVVSNAKDKLALKPETVAKHSFSSEYVSRRDKLTRRGNLYATYNSTQIMMMAQIMERTAKRMDSKKVSLNWQYTEDPNGETEVYIFSPMEQYRASIKMLRKDMAEVMRSDTFRGTGFEYGHLIAAAYETGFVTSDELDHVLKFEALWNPQTPKWKAYTDFVFGLAGSASFYLPAPWNVIGAIALVLTQAKVDGEPEPDADDNWNAII